MNFKLALEIKNGILHGPKGVGGRGQKFVVVHYLIKKVRNNEDRIK